MKRIKHGTQFGRVVVLASFPECFHKIGDKSRVYYQRSVHEGLLPIDNYFASQAHTLSRAFVDTDDGA